MREKDIERKLTKAVKDMGGLAPKFVSPGFDGVPDRLVLLPEGKLAFVELNAEGKKLRPLQEKRKNTAIFQKKPLKDTKRHLSSLAFCDMIILEKVSRACTVTITVQALIVFGGNIIPYLSK